MPRGIELALKTVNDGEIRVTDVRGDFEVSNVNGGIEMRGLAGSADVRTVNGPITLEFLDGPDEASSFSTINGDVEVYFPVDVSADLLMISRFGDLWSEFEVESVPTTPEVRETRRRHNDNQTRRIAGADRRRWSPPVLRNTERRRADSQAR